VPASNIHEFPVVSTGERDLRGEGIRPALRLSRALRVSMGCLVLIVLAGAGLSAWTVHRMHENRLATAAAASAGEHFRRMIERAEHYDAIAPRNYEDFYRDVELYAATLEHDIRTMDRMMADLAARDGDFDPDDWNTFRSRLVERIGNEADRPRLEWGAEFIAGESASLLQAIEASDSELHRQADASRRSLWWASIALAAAALLVAFATAWLFHRRVIRRISATSAAVRRIADGDFEAVRTQRAPDELGRLETDVGDMARRTGQLIDLLDRLNGARTLRGAIERVPTRLKRRFALDWIGIVGVHDSRLRLRACQPAADRLGLEQPGAGWPLRGTLMADVRRTGRTGFARLCNGDGALALEDPLLVRLRDAGLVSVALMPVRDGGRIESAVLLASRSPNAFGRWRRAWLHNVGHLIAHALYKSVHVEQLGLSMVRGLAELAERRDPTTGRHLLRMQRFAGIIAREMAARGQVDLQRHPRFVEQVEQFAPLHDIGKVGVADEILLKPGRLTPDEMAEMRRHAQIGADVLMAVGEGLGAEGDKLLAHAVDIALYHHERFDGNGYPHGLVGGAIPLSARIVALADVFDALTSRRPYKAAWSESRALEYIERASGGHFDPEVVQAFMARLDEVRGVRGLLGEEPADADAGAGSR